MIRPNAFIGVLAAGIVVAGCETDLEGTNLAAAGQPPQEPEVARLEPESNIVEAPRWRVGSKWAYSDGYGLRVTSVDDGVTVFTRTDAPSQWFSRRGFLREESQSPTTHRKIVFRTVKPNSGTTLKLGEPLVFTREYIADDVLRVHATSWTLEGRETIAVPAGSFESWVVVMRTRSTRSDWTGFERWWYSPRAQNYVRLEYKYGNMPSSSRVLLSYELAEDTGD